MNKDKQRQLMKVAYFASEIVNANMKATKLYGLSSVGFLSLAASNIEHRCSTTPWTVFCHDKPKVDKRRSKRYHRKYMEKLKPYKTRVIDCNNKSSKSTLITTMLIDDLVGEDIHISTLPAR